MSIADLFRELRDNPSGHAFTVSAVPGRSDVLLGVDIGGHPCLFVHAEELSVEAPLRTAHASLQLSQEYSVAEVGDGDRRELLHALRCETTSPAEVDTFLMLVDAFLARHRSVSINEDMLTSFFRSLVRLFSVAPARDLAGERQGLWGELFMMSRVRGFAFWAPFWHSEATRRFDFSAPNRRVEVKTASGTERIHIFSHRQIYALEGEEIVIASLMLREEEAGLSLRELIHQARLAFQGTEHYLKLERMVRHAGMESMNENGPIYDAAEAAYTLAWFRSTDAPHFRMPEPPGVSQTHYRVDLSRAPQLGHDELVSWLDRWSAASLEFVGIGRDWR